MELPHWLMLGGAFLVLAGVIGLASSRKKTVEADPPSAAAEPTERPPQQMPPLPSHEQASIEAAILETESRLSAARAAEALALDFLDSNPKKQA